MAADIVLDGEQVRVEAWDVIIDSSDRRKSSTGDRRALVHNSDDGLTLNYEGDYPGGVTILGNLFAWGGFSNVKHDFGLKLPPGIYSVAGKFNEIINALRAVRKRTKALEKQVEQLEKRVAELEKSPVPL